MPNETPSLADLPPIARWKFQEHIATVRRMAHRFAVEWHARFERELERVCIEAMLNHVWAEAKGLLAPDWRIAMDMSEDEYVYTEPSIEGVIS